MFYTKPPTAFLDLNHYINPELLNERLSGQYLYKYAPVEAVYDNSAPLIKFLLDQIRLELFKDKFAWTWKRWNWLICDIKIETLKKGEIPCLPGWHSDCTMNLSRDGNESHYLFVYGAGCRTEFINEITCIPEVKFDNPHHTKRMYEDLFYGKQTILLQEGIVYSYDRFGIHRPTRATQDGIRLLIRLTDCSFICPKYEQTGIFI